MMKFEVHCWCKAKIKDEHSNITSKATQAIAFKLNRIVIFLNVNQGASVEYIKV